MSDLSDHFRTAGVMAHMLRTLPDTYEREARELMVRHEGAKAYLDAGVAPVVIERLVNMRSLGSDDIETVLALQREHGAGVLAFILERIHVYNLRNSMKRLEREIEKLHHNPELQVSGVTIAERRAKRRERRGR